MTAGDLQKYIQLNVPLAPYTTLGIGGPARYFIEADTEETLLAAVDWSRNEDLPLLVLGGGSNLVVSDSGFPGIVVRIAIRGIEATSAKGQVTIDAGAGENWDELVELCVGQGWAGFECMSGIPGLVGATPMQNVGAYGQEVSESLVSLKALDLLTGEVVRLESGDCQFGYRTSRFKKADLGRFVITRVVYRLTPGGDPAMRYAELERHLREQGVSKPDLNDVRRAVLAIRRSKAMVIDPGEIDCRSVGSFFMNPVLTKERFEEVRERAARMALGDSMPAFGAADGLVKLSAAWLIEHSGFFKGQIFGNVGISAKHALALINRGGGTAREVVALASEIKKRVNEVFGVTLIPEPVFVGFENTPQFEQVRALN